jgi:hypothetical protein
MRHALAGALGFTWLTGAALAVDWRWPLEFTPASDRGLVALHEEIHAPRLQSARGVAVRDLHWREPQLDLHLQEGTIFLEPPVSGYPAGAFFTGKGRVKFVAAGRKVRDDIGHWFGPEGLDGHEVTHAYFFTLRGETLLAQLGVGGELSVPLAAGEAEAYEACKRALRQTGTDLLHAFLNRDGRSRGAAWVLFADSAIRVRGAADALLLYFRDPASQVDHALLGTGHGEITADMPDKYFFHRLAFARPHEGPRPPPARASRYDTRLSAGTKHGSTQEATTITLVLAEGVTALRLDLTPRLAVTAIEMGGAPLRFTQWKHRELEPYNSSAVVVAFDRPPVPGKQAQLTVHSGGALFETFGTIHLLAEEDRWYPLVDDPGRSEYELRFTVPKGREAVGVGRLVSEEVVGRERILHFQTRRPQRRSTLYLGEFATRAAVADDTKVEVFVDRGEPSEVKNLQFTLDEIGNMIKVYNRIYRPLDTEVLRVASTPTSHGRGFDGLLLLSHTGFRGESASDLFRAHEVAHQWWGNMVDGRDWPEDRWLSESFAEFSSMEYYQIRFQKPEKTREQIDVNWVRPVLSTPELTFTDLLGRKRKERTGEVSPVIDGGENVYTKGPLVLHMLRYLVRVQKGGDAAFWELMRSFLDRYRNQQASTAEFIALAGQHLEMDLAWFWDQWLYKPDIPTVRWSHTVQPRDGKWEVSVEAREEGTGFVLLVPIYAHLEENRMATRPLLIQKGEGKASMLLPEKPGRVSLNDNYESLVYLAD